MSEELTNNDVYLKGILSGNASILREIYETYHKAIIKLVETNQGTRQDAKDVFQEGLMLIYQKAQSADFKLTSSFFTYFYAVCRNIWSNKKKKKSFGEVTLSSEMTSILVDTSVETIAQNEQYALYRTKFILLGKDCQRILSLFFAKVKMVEIVEQMQLSSVAYAKKKKFKCKEQLVKMIQSDAKYQELKF